MRNYQNFLMNLKKKQKNNSRNGRIFARHRGDRLPRSEDGRRETLLYKMQGGETVKKIYIAVSVHEGGKNYAFTLTLRAGENLLNYVERYKNADIFHLCGSATEAANTAAHWNAAYKTNGTYLFKEV